MALHNMEEDRISEADESDYSDKTSIKKSRTNFMSRKSIKTMQQSKSNRGSGSGNTGTFREDQSPDQSPAGKTFREQINKQENLNMLSQKTHSYSGDVPEEFKDDQSGSQMSRRNS
jgi:hypothetical protein